MKHKPLYYKEKLTPYWYLVQTMSVPCWDFLLIWKTKQFSINPNDNILLIVLCYHNCTKITIYHKYHFTIQFCALGPTFTFTTSPCPPPQPGQLHYMHTWHNKLNIAFCRLEQIFNDMIEQEILMINKWFKWHRRKCSRDMCR